MENAERAVPAFVDAWIGKAFESGCRTPEEFRRAALDHALKGNSLAPLLDGMVARGILDAEEERLRQEDAAKRAQDIRARFNDERERLATIGRNIVMRDGAAVLAGAELSG